MRPVDGERGHAQLEQAITEHGANTNVYQAMQDITYRDDPFNPYDATLDDMSPFRHKDAIERSGAALFNWGSWMDGATADAVIHRFVNLSNPQRAAIGAWSHNLETHGSPYGKPKASPIPSQKAKACAFSTITCWVSTMRR